MSDAGEFAMFLAVGLASLGVFFGPVAGAVARRISGRSAPGPDLQPELDDLRARVSELEQAQARVEELEERVDFAERLLAQQHEPQRIGDR
jgi:hypothetical protein